MSVAMDSLSVGQHTAPITGGSATAADRISKFLGPAPQNVTPSAYDKISVTNYDLPEYYKGKNLFLRDTIDGFIKEDNEFYTTVALPWAYTGIRLTQIHLTGISRLITSSKRQFQTHVVRRGLAFIMEGDFYTTEEGEVHYMRNILGISQCVQVWALLTAKDYERAWQAKLGILQVSFTAIIQDEIDMYAMIVREEGQLEIYLEDYKKLMRKQRVTPDMLIVAPGTRLYLSMVQPRQVMYYGLDNGALEFKRGPDSMTTICDLNVYETRDFDVYSDEPAIDLLTRRWQIGERYEMVFREWRHGKIYNYESRWRDLYIYNENIDDVVKITFRSAFDHCALWEKDGQVSLNIKKWADAMKKTNSKGETRKRKHTSSASDSHPCMPPHPFITRDNDGKWDIAKYFGHIDVECATSSDFVQVGETIVAKAYGAESEELVQWNDMIHLIKDIEKQAYSEDFFKALIEKNIARSLDAKGEWKGEQTPHDLSAHWLDMQYLDEWVPNAFGSLDLPDERPADVVFPPGFANGPGFLTIANEVHIPDSAWAHIAKRADAAVKLVQRLLDVLKAVVPDSEAISRLSRSPWFHKADSFTTFFENVISIPRDPIFLAAPASVSDVTGTASEEQGKALKWTPAPLFSLDMPDGTDAEVQRAILSWKSGNPIKGWISYTDPDGNPVIAQAASFANSYMVPREMIALSLMGQYSFGSLRTVLKQLSDKGSQEALNARKNLIMFAIGHGRVNQDKTRAVIRSLADLPSPDEMINAINTIYVTQESSKVAKKNAQTMIKKLSAEFDGVPEPSIPGAAEAIPAFTQYGKEKLSPKETGAAAEIQRSMESILDNVRVMSKLRGGKPMAFDVRNPAPWFEVPPHLSGSEEDSYKGAVAATKTALATIKPTTTQPLPVKTKGGAIPLGSITTDVSAFHRAPLTMSLTLLESLTRLSDPLIRPGDPRVRHITFFGGEKNESLPQELYERPNYAHMDELLGASGVKSLEHTNFIQRHISVNISSKNEDMLDIPVIKTKKIGPHIEGGSAKKKRRQHLIVDSDSDKMDDGDDDCDDHLRKHHMGDDDDDDGKWDLEHLRQDGKRGQRNKRKGIFKIYSDLHDKLYTGTFMARFREANKISNHFLRSAVLAVLMAPLNKHQCDAMIDENIHVPFNILLWRISIEHEMSTFVIMKSGLETGANLYGHSNFATGNDVVTKMIYGNFTFNSKAVVWKEKNVMLMENVKPQRYVGGHNTRFVTHKRDLDEQGVDRPSIIATILPITEDNFPWCMSFTGYLPINDAINESIDSKQRLHYSTAQFYDHLYGITKSQEGLTMGRQTYVDVSTRVNTVAMQGLQFGFNTNQKIFSKVKECSGHRGRNGSGRGAARVWNGKKHYLDKQDWSSYILE